jgi:hypothetical protein
MVVSFQDARDFCIVAATVIPVLVLTRFIGERSPMEISLMEMDQRLRESEERVKDFRIRVQSLNERLFRIRELRRHEWQASRFKRFVRRHHNHHNDWPEGEADTLKREIDATGRDILADAKTIVNIRETMRKTMMLAAKLTVAFTAAVLLVGLVGEFFSIFGILGTIDRFYSIAIPASCIAFLIAVLGQLAITRPVLSAGEFKRLGNITVVICYAAFMVLPATFVVILLILIHATP